VTFQIPEWDWEVIQLGNCGSPIETEAGWLVLTHAVGPMRTYSISAVLLDLDDPTKMIAALKEPLLTASAEEQDGYVPNVVYTVGRWRTVTSSSFPTASPITGSTSRPPASLRC